MKRPPNIIVQLVHLQGPLKGEIQEFSESEISIGRKPSCHVRFPAELAVVSRVHALIIREGNRFKLVDHSANGTIVNGKVVKEAYLKDGDVIDFAQGGPKVSFLTQMTEDEIQVESPMQPQVQPPPEIPAVPSPPSAFEPEIPASTSRPQPQQPEDMRKAHVFVQKVQSPVVIQHGPTLQSFKEVPVTIGKNPNSDFVLDHPAILAQHCQIFVHQNEYWVKDLTGQRLVLVNGQPIDDQMSLSAEDELALSPQGPVFRFLGGGRLAEVEDQLPEAPSSTGIEDDAPERHRREESDEKVTKKAVSLFKKLLDR